MKTKGKKEVRKGGIERMNEWERKKERKVQWINDEEH